jgi:hypothetical protein
LEADNVVIRVTDDDHVACAPRKLATYGWAGSNVMGPAPEGGGSKSSTVRSNAQEVALSGAKLGIAPRSASVSDAGAARSARAKAHREATNTAQIEIVVPDIKPILQFQIAADSPCNPIIPRFPQGRRTPATPDRSRWGSPQT